MYDASFVGIDVSGRNRNRVALNSDIFWKIHIKFNRLWREPPVKLGGKQRISVCAGMTHKYKFLYLRVIIAIVQGIAFCSCFLLAAVRFLVLLRLLWLARILRHLLQALCLLPE